MQNFLLILPIESGIIKVVQNDAPVCRNGRRGGLKIPCANNTCGFDPHHRHKKGTLPACLGEFSFLSAACERVEQHGPALQGERSALRAVAQCAGDPHHRHKKEKELLHKDKTCAAAPFFYCLQLYLCLCSRCSICSAGITSLRSTSLPQAHHSETAFCSFSTPACVRRLRSSAPTMQDTTILPRSSAMKG